MQNDDGFGQPDFMGNPQQSSMGGFVTTPSDMFSYPLSAPATTPAFGSQRSFWDADMGNMDIDFSANGNTVFHSSDSVDWVRTNQFLQETGAAMHGHGDENTPTGKPNHSMTSQAALQALGTSAAEQALFAASFPAPVDDPFGIVNNGGAVNPGLLFSRPQSSNMDLSFQAAMQPSNGPASAALQEAHTGRRPLVSKVPARGELRRSASEKEIVPTKQDRATASSPIKPTGRPGLTRSFSESRGKKSLSRSSLPTLAPAPRPQSQMVNLPGGGAARSVVSQGGRSNGRSSPLKGHHQRLPSLSSIPETTGPRTRTRAKFTIDANGRARVETTIIIEDDAPPTIRKHRSAQPLSRHRWTSSEEEDESSTDEEPIIIPSRNASFALPDPRKPTSVYPFHSSQRSISEQSSTSYTTFQGSLEDGDSDRETVANDITPTGKPSGDAASELRKLRNSRRGQLPSVKPRFVSLGAVPGTAGFAGSYANHELVSPTTETTLPTPSTDSRTRGIRCICNRNRADGFLVQWYGESPHQIGDFRGSG